MKQIDKKATPLATLKGLQGFLTEINNIANQNLLLIKKRDSDEFFFEALDVDSKSNFFFHVSDVEYSKNVGVLFTSTYAPNNDTEISSIKRKNSHKGTIESFKNWIERLNAYNLIEISEEDRFKGQYEQEFEEIFEIIDEDAEINPFDIERQIFINKYLEGVIKKLQANNSEEHIEIVQEVKKLQENLQNYTKKETVRSLSKIWAKIRKKGIKLLLDFYDVAKKEALKKLLYGGLDEAGSLLDKFF